MSVPQSCKYRLYACDDPNADNFVWAWHVVAGSVRVPVIEPRPDWFSWNYATGLFEAIGDNVLGAYIPSPSMCQYGGCNDTLASNYQSWVTFNNGTCVYPKIGCVPCSFAEH